MSRITPVVAGIAGGALALGLLAMPALATPRTAAADKTTAAEAARVDRVPTPKLDWTACQVEGVQCATVSLPLDYDKPTGTKVSVAVARRMAADPAHRIGSLFINPGGPGGSATRMVNNTPKWLSKSILDRFDIVGFDPRGIAKSQQVRCFKTPAAQQKGLGALSLVFPEGAKEEKAYIASARTVGAACASTGRPLTASVSTAEVARDMDVLRRAVGDDKLSYLGFSYGTALGQYYANMFPDRMRAIVVDGVINPVSWVGDPKKPSEQDSRLESADGAYEAFMEIMIRCQHSEQCVLGKHAKRTFAAVVAKTKKSPVSIVRADGTTDAITYASMIGELMGYLYEPKGFTDAVDLIQRVVKGKPVKAVPKPAPATGPYDNGLEAGLAVTCSDGVHPKDAGEFSKLMVATEKRAPYFGKVWGWQTAVCASKTWKAQDKLRYMGPFNRKTAAPVMFVGDYWDPATNFNDAVSSAKLNNGYLIRSDSWGHTAYGTSKCVTDGVDNYLLTLTKPGAAICVGDVQPFAPVAPTARTERADGGAALAPGAALQLPPVVNPWSVG